MAEYYTDWSAVARYHADCDSASARRATSNATPMKEIMSRPTPAAQAPRQTINTLCVNIQTTGLDPATQHILQIAVVALDQDAQQIAAAWAFLALPDDASIEDGALKIHEQTGLLDEYTKAAQDGTLKTMPEFWDHLTAQLPPCDMRIVCSSQGEFLTKWLAVHYPRLSAGAGRICSPGQQINPKTLCRLLGVDYEDPARLAPACAEYDAQIIQVLRQVVTAAGSE